VDETKRDSGTGIKTFMQTEGHSPELRFNGMEKAAMRTSDTQAKIRNVGGLIYR
jgi:hypothetical protein